MLPIRLSMRSRLPSATHPPHSRKLKKELELVRQRGYALDRERMNQGLPVSALPF